MPFLLLLVVLLFLAALFCARWAISENRAAGKAREEVSRLNGKFDEQSRLIEIKEQDFQKRLNDRDELHARAIEEKEKVFVQMAQKIKEQFVNITNEQVQKQGDGLAKLNRESLKVLLDPVREQVKVLQELSAQSSRENAVFGKSIAKDVGEIGRIAQNLQGIATALTSNTRVQGRSGEDVLAEKLRQAGLEEGVNFFLQRGMSSDRPDAQVCDPENRWLIIDSKVSLTSYIEYETASDDSTRAEKLRLHLASVKSKIDQLAKKQYARVFEEEFPERNYLPVTAMFVPYEAPLQEALRAEPSLWQYAAERNVMLVTPLTLLAYMRLVFLAWQHEKQIRNQQEITETARELLERLNAFLLAFENIEKTIEKLSDAYLEAKKVLVDAPRAQTIGNSARKLINLGVRLQGKRGQKLKKAECLLSDDEKSIVETEESS